MKIDGQHYQTIQLDEERQQAVILDQTLLPFEVRWLPLTSLAVCCTAIQTMQVRGAPAIGAVAAFGVYLAVIEAIPLVEAAKQLKSTRPTAVNLAWAVDRLVETLSSSSADDLQMTAFNEVQRICRNDVEACNAIGDYGVMLIEDIAKAKPGQVVNILTHCNAGWLATVDWGTALSPIYKAQAKGIDIHIWVDETRPRNQGALLTAFELKEQAVPHTLICDNAGGHLMQQGKVDLCLVGSDRTAANGDVCNKIGTYLKALAAYDNHIPFYVALPTSTVDWQMESGRQVTIEERSGDELCYMSGIDSNNAITSVRLCEPATATANPAFDVTPSRLVSGLITEYGIFSADKDGLLLLKKQLSV